MSTNGRRLKLGGSLRVKNVHKRDVSIEKFRVYQAILHYGPAAVPVPRLFLCLGPTIRNLCFGSYRSQISWRSDRALLWLCNNLQLVLALGWSTWLCSSAGCFFLSCFNWRRVDRRFVNTVSPDKLLVASLFEEPVHCRTQTLRFGDFQILLGFQAWL